jgi:hypothetical protein
MPKVCEHHTLTPTCITTKHNCSIDIILCDCVPNSSAFFSFSFIISCVRASGGKVTSVGRGARGGGLPSGCGIKALSLLKASSKDMACNQGSRSVYKLTIVYKQYWHLMKFKRLAHLCGEPATRKTPYFSKGSYIANPSSTKFDIHHMLMIKLWLAPSNPSRRDTKWCSQKFAT